MTKKTKKITQTRTKTKTKRRVRTKLLSRSLRRYSSPVVPKRPRPTGSLPPSFGFASRLVPSWLSSSLFSVVLVVVLSRGRSFFFLVECEYFLTSKKMKKKRQKISIFEIVFEPNWTTTKFNFNVIARKRYNHTQIKQKPPPCCLSHSREVERNERALWSKTHTNATFRF